MLGLIVSVTLFWTLWFWVGIPDMIVAVDPMNEGLSTIIYIMVAIFHITWLGKLAR